MRVYLCALLLLALCVPAWADPRFTGTFLRADAAHRMVVIKLDDGTIVTGKLRADAHGVSSLKSFHKGEQVVIEVSILNESPLDVEGLYDYRSAGTAPGAHTAVTNTIETHGFAISGSVSNPGPVAPPDIMSKLGYGSNGVNGVVAPPASTWDPAHPWANVGVTGQYDPNSISGQVQGSNTMVTSSGTPVYGMNPDGTPATAPPGQRQQWQQAPQYPNSYDPNTGIPQMSGPMYTQSSPANSPWIGQAVSMQNQQNSQQSQQRIANDPRNNGNDILPPSQPQMMPPPQMMPMQQQANNPSTLIDPDLESSGTVSQAANPQMPNIISVQGQITQIDVTRRAFMMQCMVNGNLVPMTVRVPAQLQILAARSSQMVSLETLQRGDYVMVTGLQSGGAFIEARRMSVNNK